MNKNWTTETAVLLKKVNNKTKRLMKLNLPTEEFSKRHQEIMDFWETETVRLQEKYPLSNKPKARPKRTHSSNHLTEKFQIKKIFRKFFNNY